MAFFEKQKLSYELILVNDHSRDQSWAVLQKHARANCHLIAINLLHNYGQHTALLCGFQKSRGNYVITLDDDLQNPPEEMIHLITKIAEGHDLVFGRFREKKHASYRRTGSLLINLINERIFHKPRDLTCTNFRNIRRDEVDRICSYRTNYPYITGLALMFSDNPANVWVEHQKRPVGKSNYNLFKIVELVTRILFNYSTFPLRLVSLVGLLISVLSFLLGLYYLARAIFIGIQVPGWATTIVLLSFFNGMTLLILSMLGEYTMRLLNQVSYTEYYQIKEIIAHDD
jgi:glycosyltransferase involved in cell wall biosynthesis